VICGGCERVDETYIVLYAREPLVYVKSQGTRFNVFKQLNKYNLTVYSYLMIKSIIRADFKGSRDAYFKEKKDEMRFKHLLYNSI